MTTRGKRRAAARALCVLGVLIPSVLVAGRAAWASDGGVSTADLPSISPELLVPRFLPGGGDAGAPAHLNDFTPAAINYADCINALDLEFTLDLANAGAVAGDEIQAWASSGEADCTQPSARTNTSSTTPGVFPGRCWPAGPSTAFTPTGTTSTARLHVRDLVAYIGRPDPPTTYPSAGYSVTSSNDVCIPYATNSAVQLNVYFIFVPASGTTGDGGTVSTPSAPDGISGLYRTSAALVGPFEPLSVSVPNTGITPTSLTVYWSPQSQSIIQGYNIYVQDQGTTGANTGFTGSDASSSVPSGVRCHPKLTCSVTSKDAGQADAHTDAHHADAHADAHEDAHEDGGVADAGVDSGDKSGDDSGVSDASDDVICDAGLSDAWVDAAEDLGMSTAELSAEGCEQTYAQNVTAPSTDGGGMTCVSGVLVETFVVDGGLGSVASVSSVDGSVTANGFVTDYDAGSDADVDAASDGSTNTITGSTTASTTSSGGTVQETAGISNISSSYFNYYQSGGTSSAYTVPDLITGHHYAIAVAAVDSYGNVGPIGALGCSIPTAVQDFYTLYSMDGGSAGGGFCTVSGAGASACSLFGVGMAAVAGAFVRRRRARRNR